ncbi:MAG: ACT domain-containing protein [Deltaproteobacteria bacterium]
MKLWEEIESAEKRIRNAILRTPMICSDTLSTLTGQEVFLKLENLQKGGSFKVNLLDRIIEKGLSQTGRMVRLGVLLRDVPGSLARLSNLVAEHHANILHIVHERADRDIPIGFSRVVLVLETRGPDHIRKIQKGLKKNGYVLQVRSLRNASFM